jgi:hypothetical protein
MAYDITQSVCFEEQGCPWMEMTSTYVLAHHDAIGTDLPQESMLRNIGEGLKLALTRLGLNV